MQGISPKKSHASKWIFVVFFCCCCWKNKPQRSLHFLYNYIDDWTRNPHAHINRGIHTLSNVLTLTLSVSSHSVCFLSFTVIVFFHCMRSTKCKERATYQNAYCHNGRYWKQKIRKNGIYITQMSASIQKKNKREHNKQRKKRNEMRTKILPTIWDGYVSVFFPSTNTLSEFVENLMTSALKICLLVCVSFSRYHRCFLLETKPYD